MDEEEVMEEGQMMVEEEVMEEGEVMAGEKHRQSVSRQRKASKQVLR